MNTFLKKIIIVTASIVVFILATLLILDNIILPNYVEAPVYSVPDVVGMHQDKAMQELENANLEPVVKAKRFDEKFEADHVIYQNPNPGSEVKEGRRIYLFISSGDPRIKMPDLEGKTLRDARITLERLGLHTGVIERVRSENFPADIIISQEIESGIDVSKGDSVNLQISIGPQYGKIRVPALLGKSLSEAEKALKGYSLRLGKIIYKPSKRLLYNTVVEQYPSEGKLVGYGDSVDVVVTKNFSGGDE